jgi:hypothetical protein
MRADEAVRAGNQNSFVSQFHVGVLTGVGSGLAYV